PRTVCSERPDNVPGACRRAGTERAPGATCAQSLSTGAESNAFENCRCRPIVSCRSVHELFGGLMSDGEVDRDQANVMAGRICAAAGLSAQSECELLERIGEFDAVNAIRWWVDVKSLAHWLSWCCSMPPGTAREHVRV